MVQDFATTWSGESRAMPTLVTGARLREAVEKGTFIQGGDVASVEGVKYDFHMGSRILKASYGQPIDLDKLPEAERSTMRVEPGEAVFVLTRESLNLPGNFIAILSPKRKLGHSGIIVLGGLSIDPLYRGPLWVGLYNFSSTAFPLQPGKKLIAALFYELAGPELDDFQPPEAAPLGGFPDELITLIRNYRPVELKSLTDALAETQKRLDALVTEVRDDRNWKRDFQDALDKQSKEIDKLLEGLKEEKEARKEEDKAIKSKLESMSNLFTGARMIWIVIATLIVALLGGLADHFVPKWLGRG